MIAETVGPRVEDAASDPFVAPARRYVVGVDGSAASRAALAWALARGDGREVRLLGVIDDDGGMGAAHTQELSRRLARLLSDAAQEAATASPAARVTTGLVRGSVASALATAAEPGDVVVIGSDKTGYARGRLYGLRAVQLAAAATGSIAVVPSIDLRLRSGVAVAVVDPASAPGLARLGAREAARRGCSLSLVHAVPPSGHRAAAHGDEVLDLARHAALDEHAHVDVWTHVARRRPAEAILDLSRNRALLLVGRSRRTTPLGVGETLHEVLMNANAPTIVVAAAPHPER